MAGDFLGRLGGLHRQRFDFGGDHREALARLAGARGLDGGVERQQIGLPGDGADQLDHVADLLRASGKPGDLVVGCARLAGRQAHHVAGVGELAADLGDRVRQFVGRDRRGLHVGGSFIESLHGTFGALRGLIGGAEQRGGCRTHGGRAVAHAGQKFLHLRAERGDGRVDDRAPLLLVADGGAFGLGVTLLGDVLMGGDPAAVRQQLIFGEHDAAIACLHVMLRAFALADAVEDFFAISGDVAGEQSCVFAMLDQCVQRAARLHDVGRELIHFEVAPVEQGNAALLIEHVQPLRHVQW